MVQVGELQFSNAAWANMSAAEQKAARIKSAELRVEKAHRELTSSYRADSLGLENDMLRTEGCKRRYFEAVAQLKEMLDA